MSRLTTTHVDGAGVVHLSRVVSSSHQNLFIETKTPWKLHHCLYRIEDSIEKCSNCVTRSQEAKRIFLFTAHQSVTLTQCCKKMQGFFFLIFHWGGFDPHLYIYKWLAPKGLESFTENWARSYKKGRGFYRKLKPIAQQVWRATGQHPVRDLEADQTQGLTATALCSFLFILKKKK
jgi:hypothetical protein